MAVGSEERRVKIENVLKEADSPVSATSLAKMLSVSRQIIVGDIALMRAAGLEINATPRGYMLGSKYKEDGFVYTIACIHNDKDMREELYTIVDNGCEVIDVVVEHKVYGQLTGMLHIKSRYDVDQFMDRLDEGDAPLSSITGGIHVHNLRCPSKEDFLRVKEQLKAMGILFES